MRSGGYSGPESPQGSGTAYPAYCGHLAVVVVGLGMAVFDTDPVGCHKSFASAEATVGRGLWGRTGAWTTLPFAML